MTGRAREVTIDLAFLTVAFAAAAAPLLSEVLASPEPGGWDGVGHFAAAELYARHGFPSAHGWLPELFAGMPFPDFYPPLFYWLVGGLALLLPTRLAFWTVLIAASLATPLLTYGVTRRLVANRLGAVVAGVVTIGYLVDRSPGSAFGITLFATFSIGLVSQVTAYVALLAFLFAFLRAPASRSARLAAGVALGVVPLANVHIVWNAACLFVGLSAVRLARAAGRAERLRLVGSDALVVLVAGGTSALWVLPMLARLHLVPTLALEALPPGVLAAAFLRPSAYLLVAVPLAWVRKNDHVLGLAVALALTFALSVVPFEALGAGDLAVQPHRIAIGYKFLSALAVGGVVAGLDALPRRSLRILAATAIAATFVLSLRPTFAYDGALTPAQHAAYGRALGHVPRDLRGRVLVEVGRASLSDGFGLQARMAREGRSTLTAIFRESSLSTLFAVPLRNSLSGQIEAWGVDSKLDPAALARDPPARHAARLDLFAVQNLFAASPAGRAFVERLPGVTRVSPPEEPWAVYRRPLPASPLAMVPAYEPVLTFAELSVKHRAAEQLDFMRLNEHLFAAGELDVPLVLADGPLDAARLDPYRAALVTAYRYADRGDALRALEAFSRRGVLLVAPSADPLYERLVALAQSRPNVVLLGDRTAGPAAVLTALSAALRTTRVPVEGAPRVASAELSPDVVRVRLDRAAARPLPVWIRQSFFPTWTAADGAPVALATPSFQLAFLPAGRSELVLRRTTGPLETLGYAATGLTLVLVLATWIVAWRRRRLPPRPSGPNATPARGGRAT